MDGTSDEIRLREIQREYLDFLDDEVKLLFPFFFFFFSSNDLFNSYLIIGWLQQDQGFYSGKVKDMIAENRHRLIVNINDLRRKKPTRARA